MAKGKCVNIVKGCSNALGKKVIEADKANFVCPECGKPLVEVVDVTPKSWWERLKKHKWLVIALVVVVVAGVVIYFANPFGSKESVKQPEQEQIVTDPETTETEINDTSDTDTTGTDEPKTGEDTTNTEEPKPAKIFGGAATMSGSTILFKGKYTLDLGTMDGETINVLAGDTIVDATIQDGCLTSGFLKCKNRKERYLSGIRIPLK